MVLGEVTGERIVDDGDRRDPRDRLCAALPPSAWMISLMYSVLRMPIRSSRERRPNAIMRPRRATIAACLLLLAVILMLVSTERAATEATDDSVTLRIDNVGTEPLRCTILFAHWVSLDAGVIGVGASRSLAMMRRVSDGSLYVARSDGRPMMIENVVCGTVDAWAVTLGQIPLLAVRTSGERALSTPCKVDERVICAQPSVQ